jgi:hypothetical protein
MRPQEHCVVSLWCCLNGSCAGSVLPPGERRWDSPSVLIQAEKSSDRPVVRGTILSDEGPCQVAISNFLMTKRCKLLMWRDPPHRITNFIGLAMGQNAAVRRCYRLMSRVFKLSRGPWSGCRFGRMLRKSCRELSCQHVATLCTCG